MAGKVAVVDRRPAFYTGLGRSTAARPIVMFATLPPQKCSICHNRAGKPGHRARGGPCFSALNPRPRYRKAEKSQLARILPLCKLKTLV